MIAVSVIFTGCATPPVPPAPHDEEPVLTGKPMSERLAAVSNDINNQMELLNNLNAGKKVGSFTTVVHNNELDARKNSNNTIPKSYGVATQSVQATSSPDPVLNAQDKIKKIDWKNGSLNDLVKNFAVATNYKLILVAPNKDKVVSFHVENETVANALNRLKTQISSFALLTVVDKEKTIYLNYN